MGFKIGAAKLDCLQRAIVLEQEGATRALRLVDQEPGTFAEKFKGRDLSQADIRAVSASDTWHLGLSGMNAWLLLPFDDDRLVEIERKEHRGPTE